MTIYSVYIINKAGGLIYQYDHNIARPEVEKTFSFPLELTLKLFDEKIVVAFGERDGIKVGHTLLSVNGVLAEGKFLPDGRDILDVLKQEENFPINLKFGRPKLTTNEKIMLASMFHSLFAIGSQLSPEPRSSGIEMLETDTFKLHCQQTMTEGLYDTTHVSVRYLLARVNSLPKDKISGLKFIVIADPRQAAVEILLKKLYEVYADYALKNPFYSIDMPIRCDLFDTNLQLAIEQAEKLGISNV